MQQSVSIIVLIILLNSYIYSQTIEKNEINNKIKNTKKTYVPQTIGDKVLIKDEEGNSLIEINDEGTFGSITLPDSAGSPLITTNKLYNVSGTLNFNGTAFGVGGANNINELSDGYSDDTSIFLGAGAGASDDGGDSDGSTNLNTAIGINALYSNTTGVEITATGYQAVYRNTTASYHTSYGYQALYSNTIGEWNTAFGYQALYSNEEGSFNTSFGYQSLYSNYNAGHRNTAFGFNTLYSNTFGINNIAIGYKALFSNTDGNNNVAIGYEALYLSNGVRNIALGYQAGYNENGDDKLYIENSSSSTPLIGGDFSKDEICLMIMLE